MTYFAIIADNPLMAAALAFLVVVSSASAVVLGKEAASCDCSHQPAGEAQLLLPAAETGGDGLSLKVV